MTGVICFCVIMCFARRPPCASAHVQLLDLGMPVVAEYRYFGVVLDPGLLWTSHVECLGGGCEKGLDILRCVAKES